MLAFDLVDSRPFASVLAAGDEVAKTVSIVVLKLVMTIVVVISS